jgi:hypothetical protein
MAAGRASDLLLFVTGASAAPSLGPAVKAGQGPSYSAESAMPTAVLAEGHLPRRQVRCVNTVLRVARREGCRVTVVDVAHAAGRQGLVDRWVGVNDELPILVRPDGRRLCGCARIDPRTVRELILGS